MPHVLSPPPGSPANQSVTEQPCPRCQSATLRIWRRPVDRMALRPTRRYRCQAFLCQWEGNVRLPREAGLPPPEHSDPASRYGATEEPSDAPMALPRTFLLSMAVALATGAFILITAYTHWLEPGGFLVSATTVLPFDSNPC